MLADLEIIHLGTINYLDALTLQEGLNAKIIANLIPPQLLFCQHPPTITLGTSAKSENLLVSQDKLNQLGITLIKTNRGGDITYHGPGQMICYPLIDLRKLKRDVAKYMHNLEEVIMLMLLDLNIRAARFEGNRGVWIYEDLEFNDQKHSRASADAAKLPLKIASMGVKLRKWCTFHGVALNTLSEDLEHFKLINPCGFQSIEMTSIENQINKKISMTKLQDSFIKHFISVFNQY